jgi:hypothetical protein
LLSLSIALTVAVVPSPLGRRGGFAALVLCPVIGLLAI